MRIFLAVSLISVAVACLPPGEEVAFESVLSTNDSLDFIEPESFVVRTADQWCGFWASAHSTHTEPPTCDLGVVDFEQEAVLAVTMGMRPNGCYSISIDRVETGQEPGSITVFVREQVPGAGCFCTHSITSPAEAVVVDNPIGPVDFIRESVTLQCE